MIVTLGRSVFTHQAGIVQGYICMWLDAYGCGISRQNSFKGGGGGGENVKPLENPNFMKKGKMVISVKIQKFSRSQMTKQTSPLESSREI